MQSYVTELEGAPRGWRYGSDLAVYTERFVDGRLLCASHINNGIPVYQAHERAVVPAFGLVIDGQPVILNNSGRWACSDTRHDETSGILAFRAVFWRDFRLAA